MANPGHVAVVEEGYWAITEWRLKNSGARFDLSDADLHYIDLSPTDVPADLRDANLSEADFSDPLQYKQSLELLLKELKR